MTLSRRRALGLLTGGVAAGAAGALLWHFSPYTRTDVARRVRRALPEVGLPHGETGPLEAATAATLLALPQALVDHEVERDHYAAFYRFRAGTLPGYRDLYEAFARELGSTSRRLSGSAFADTSPAERRGALRELGLRPAPASAAAVLPGRMQLARFDRYIVRETLRLFNATDAWVLAGYGTWPGRPRTLEYYLQAPVPSAPRA